MPHVQRIVLVMVGMVLLMTIAPTAVQGQAAPPQTSPDITEVTPLLPPGISDFDLELYGKLAYTWTLDDGTQVIEVRGDFSARMGPYKLSSQDAVVWFKSIDWHDRRYLDFELFLWQQAEIDQPGGTVETGPVLLATLRSFGKLVLNVDSHAAVNDAQSDLFAEAQKARRLLDVVPAQQAEVSKAPVQISPSLEQLKLAQPKLRKTVTFSADRTVHQQHGDQSIVITIGNVLLSQGSPAKSGDYVEIRADAAVLYMKSQQIGRTLPGLLKGEDHSTAPPPASSQKLEQVPPDISPQEEPKLTDSGKPDRKSLEKWVSAVYLDGDVVLTRGQRMIRASRLYYDFDNDRALILDMVTRAYEPKRGLPIYIRAEEARQLTSRRYTARNAQITTSEFHTPHVAIGAGEVQFEDITPRNEQGDIIGIQAGTYQARNTTLNLQGTPIAYWPYSAGNFSRDRQALRKFKTGYTSEFGAAVETEWYLFNLLGLQQPEGFDATLKLDYFSNRGPAAGIDMDYSGDDYFGLLRSYYLHDDDEDDLGPTRGGEPDHENRGRFLLRHRQFLPKGWELSLEASYISDDQYLESFERNEFENGKDQETLAYLLKRKDNWQFSTLLNWRINEFDTQTEHLPDTQFSLIGQPLGDFTTFYSENHAGVVRLRHDERRVFNGQNRFDNTGETGSVLRADSRQEFRFLLPELGPVKLTPYFMVRGTGWDDSPGKEGGGSEGRGFVSYGLHGNTLLSRVYEDIQSDFFDLHRLRHIIKADFTAFGANSTDSPGNLTPFDPGVEDIDDFSGVTLGLRQRFQTKRGGPGHWRSVDWITFDLEAGFYNDASSSEPIHDNLDLFRSESRLERLRHFIREDRRANRTHGDFIFSRPEDSIPASFIAANFQYRISDSTVVVYDGVYDANRNQMGTSNVSIAVEREPRLAYFAGWRFINDTDNNVFTFGANYKLSQKHTVAFRELYDIDLGRNFTTEFIYIRRWPRWYTAVTFDVDRSLDDVGINLSIWPEGAPSMGLGSKRFTGLTDSVGLQLR